MTGLKNRLVGEALSVVSLDKLIKEKMKEYEKGRLPKTFQEFYSYANDYTLMGEFARYRSGYIKKYGYALLSEDWVKPLAKWIGNKKCLEIMAGSGWLSKSLSLYGVNIKATDKREWDMEYGSNVEKLDARDAILRYGRYVDYILCSWPYMDSDAVDALVLMREVNPNCRFIYIGEGWGGCTADDAFFNTFDVLSLVGFDKAVEKYVSWYGIHDRIVLGK